MSTHYTLIMSVKRPVPGIIQLWDIVDKETFYHPNDLGKWISNNYHLLRKSGYRSYTNIRAELYENNNYTKAMPIVSLIPEGRRKYDLYIKLVNGKHQLLSTFLFHWQTEIRAAREMYAELHV